MRARLPLRLARSAVFTVVCVALAVLGHRAAGGDGPVSWTVAAGGLAVAGAAVVLAGRERSPQAVVGSLVGMQVLLHQLFGVSTADGPVLRLHLGHAGGLGADLGMIAAHLTATLITGWWLARGESALWSVLRRLGVLAVRRLRRVLALLTADVAGPRRPAVHAPRHLFPAPCTRRLRQTLRRRGPPLPAAF